MGNRSVQNGGGTHQVVVAETYAAPIVDVWDAVTSPDRIPPELATEIGVMTAPGWPIELRRPDGRGEPLTPQGWEHSL